MTPDEQYAAYEQQREYMRAEYDERLNFQQRLEKIEMLTEGVTLSNVARRIKQIAELSHGWHSEYQSHKAKK